MATVYKCASCHEKDDTEELCAIKIIGHNMPLIHPHICVIDGSNDAEFKRDMD